MSEQLSVADVLERAATLIEPEGAWVQDSGDGHTTFCAARAIHASVAGDQGLYRAARNAVIATLSGRMLTVWNDAPERTQAEVVAKLREAAALARSTFNDADNRRGGGE